MKIGMKQELAGKPSPITKSGVQVPPLSDINRSSSNTPLKGSESNPPQSFRRGIRQSM
jgi:hypothetical protein